VLKAVLFVYNSEKPGAEEAARRGLRWCERRGIRAEMTPRRRFFVEETDLVVAIGGDGTLLRVAAELYPREIPILGVHTGSLGFLTACEAEAIESALEELAAGRVRLERRLRLEVEGQDVTALNDVVVVGPAEARFTELEVWADGEPLMTLSGDGVVVASPTGATAYALACGASVLHPEVACLLIAPVAPHQLDVRPVILPEDVEVRIRALYPADVRLDGDRLTALAPEGEIVVRAAPSPTLLVRLPGEESFFTRLRRKLGWARGPEGREI